MALELKYAILGYIMFLFGILYAKQSWFKGGKNPLKVLIGVVLTILGGDFLLLAFTTYFNIRIF